MKEHMKRKTSGITLIALVVTIIVLLLLAGISISMLTGNNSILKRAQEAKEATEIAQIKEEAERVRNDYFMNKYLGDSKLSADNSDNKSVQRYAITNLINRHFEESTKSGNRVTTIDEKYDIIVRNNLDIVVVKHGERYLKVGELEITYYVPEEDKGKKTIELYFELGDVPNPNVPTGDGVTYISFEEYMQNVASKKYENKTREELEELVAQAEGYEGTFDEMLTEYGMTREQLAQQAEKHYNMSYDEYLIFSLSYNRNSEYEYYAYLAGAEEKTQEELEEMYVELIEYDGTFSQFLSSVGITSEAQYNEYIEQQGFTSHEDFAKYLVAMGYAQKIEKYQQQFGDIELACPDGSRKYINQVDMYTEYEVKQNGIYTFIATGPNGEEGTVTIEINDLVSVKITPETITIYEGEIAVLTVNGISSNKVTWESSNPSVATVENGKVTGIKAGTSTITATTSDGTAISDFCTVKVNESIKLDGAMVLKETTEGNDTMTNEGMTTNNSNIATITSEGIVKCGTETGNTIVTVNGTQYVIKSTAKIVHTASSTSPINGTATYNNPVIPKGYSAIDTEDSKWDLTATTQPDVNKGLVIMDEDGNQFVWIPVQTPVSDTEKKGTTNKAMAVNVGTTESPKYRGLLYEFTNTNGTLSSTVRSGCTSAKSEAREPDILTDTSYGDWSTISDRGLNLIRSLVDGYSGLTDDQIKTKWTTQLQTEYNDIIASVIKYNGFYIGRYESSLINDSTKSVSNSYSMTANTSSANTWYGLYQKQKNYWIKSNETTITEGNMIYGSQWNAMMNWMMNNGVDVTSNTPITGATRNRTRYTGSQKKDKLKNIFDLLGNSYEWTQMAEHNKERLGKGGSYERSLELDTVLGAVSPSNHGVYEIDNPNRDSWTSRLTLYVK